MDSEVLLASRFVTIEWLECGNPTYTYLKDIETKLEKAMAKTATGNPIAAVQFALIKAEQIIRCIPNKFFGTRAQSDGVLIQTTNNYCQYALNLLGMVSSEKMLLYNVISKEMKQVLREDDYDRLITSNQVELNQQRQITFVNVAEGFFETSINIAPNIKDSQPYPIRMFIHGRCKIMAIERTRDSHKLRKWILI